MKKSSAERRPEERVVLDCADIAVLSFENLGMGGLEQRRWVLAGRRSGGGDKGTITESANVRSGRHCIRVLDDHHHSHLLR